MLRNRYMALSCLVTSLTACGPNAADGSDTLGLVADAGAKNIALIFGSSGASINSPLGGVAKDLEELPKVLQNRLFHFEVVTVHEAKRADIIRISRESAAKVGANGTLLWYFSGHGAETGELVPADATPEGGNMLAFRDVAAGIKEARTSPLKRLLVLVDSCFSGMMVDGGAAVQRGLGLDDTTELVDRLDVDVDEGALSRQRGETMSGGIAAGLQARGASELYEQALIFSSAAKNETAGDAGSEYGGTFTYVFRSAFYDYARNSPHATIGDLTRDVVQAVREVTSGKQTPVFRAEPSAAVLAEPLFYQKAASGDATKDTLP